MRRGARVAESVRRVLSYKWGRHDEFKPKVSLPGGLQPFLWPILLSLALVGGLLVSLVCLARPRTAGERRARAKYWNARAACEAGVAIVSGGLLWIGFWDVMDEYLVPKEWWAKLCMLLVGLLGTLGTRSLYSDATLQAIREAHRTEGTSAACEDGEVEMASPVRAMQMTPVREVVEPRAARRRGWCCFDPPRFSCSRCSHALLSTFFGLTMWVGLWDLLDAHILPTAFASCARGPSKGCASVKLSLVAVGAFGLWLTRSLYGEAGTGGAVQFSRIE